MTVDSSIDESIRAVDGAFKKISSIAEQDMFDNFGNLIASQLRSIPVEEALELQTEITGIINKSLLQIHRAKSNSSSRQSSRPSTFATNYDYSTDYSSEITQPPTPVYHDLNVPQEENVYENNYDVTRDLVARALQGI